MPRQGYIPDDPLPYQQKSSRQQQANGYPYRVPQQQIPQQTYPLQTPQLIQSQPFPVANRSAAVKKSVILLIAGIIGLAYFTYLLVYFNWVSQSAVSELGEGIGQFAAAFAVRMVTPHIIAVGVAVLVNAVAWWMNKEWLAIVAALVYMIAGILFMNYMLYVLPMILMAGVSFFLMLRRKT